MQLWSGNENVKIRYVNGSFLAGTSASSLGAHRHVHIAGYTSFFFIKSEQFLFLLSIPNWRKRSNNIFSFFLFCVPRKTLSWQDIWIYGIILSYDLEGCKKGRIRSVGRKQCFFCHAKILYKLGTVDTLWY